MEAFSVRSDPRDPPTRAKLDLVLPRHPAAASIARRELVRCYTRRLDEALLIDITIATNELVSNALEHGVGAIRMQIQALGDHVRLEVSDEGDGFMAPSEPDAHRGLAIVDSLADDWGVKFGSTHVWCDFAIAPRQPRATA